MANDGDRRHAARRYAELVADTGSDGASIWQEGLRQQIFLGDEAFVMRMQAMASNQQRACIEVPRIHRKPSRSLDACLAEHGDRGKALSVAFRECGMTMSEMARELGLSVSRVSRLIAGAESRK